MTGDPDPLDVAAGYWLENLLSQNHAPGPPYVHTFGGRSEPEAIITKHGWRIYSVTIRDGLIGLREPWWCLGRRHAESKARRELARWNREPVTWTITG